MIKPRFDLVDEKFIRGLAIVFAYGRVKYPNNDLSDTPWDANLKSLQNHTDDLRRGILINEKDWGLPTEFHIGARAMMAYLIRTKKEEVKETFDEAAWLERVRDEK